MPGSDFDESESVSVNPEFLEILKTLNPKFLHLSGGFTPSHHPLIFVFFFFQN